MHLKRGLILLLALLLIVINLLNIGAVYLLTGRAVSSTTGQLNLCFNPPPDLGGGIPDQSVEPNTRCNYLVGANDTGGQTLTYYDNTTLFEINSSLGTINFTPNINDTGNHSILITVADSGTDCPFNSSASFILNVSNRPPTLLAAIPNQTWEEDVSLTGLDLDTYFSDADPLTFTTNNGSYVKITINSNTSVVTFTPAKDWNGITWVIFIANDSRETTESNNVTLNVTNVTNFCGDRLCNSGEDCNSCATDCGTCPASGGGGGGGGGGTGFNIIEKILREPAEAVCAAQSNCVDWLPESCVNSQTQQRSCLTIGENCQAKEELQERPCLCQPRWECTIWVPENCAEGSQQRQCLDINQCGLSFSLPLQRDCASTAVMQKPTAALAGQAFFSGIEIPLRRYGTPALIGVAAVLMLFIFYALGKWYKRLRKPSLAQPQIPNKELLLQRRREILRKIAEKKKNKWSQRFLAIEEKLRRLK